jgi:transposase
VISLASGLRVYLACGVTDMRKGKTRFAMLVQQVLAEDPFGGAGFAFRGRCCISRANCTPRTTSFACSSSA